MKALDVALLEWPDGREAGGPRMLGRTDDPEIIKLVRERLARQRRAELSRLEPPVRLASEPDEDPES